MSAPGSPNSFSGSVGGGASPTHGSSHGTCTITYDPSRRPRRKTEKTILPEDYEPSKFSVICGRGKGSYQSDGNVNFRALVKSNLERYKEAPGRLEKSFIVSEVLNCIRESCPVGAFVKYENGRWYDLEDTVCREKVGSLFRDFLHTTYKSSSKAKHARKVAEKSQQQQQQRPAKQQKRLSKTSSGLGTPSSSPEKSPRKQTSPTAKRRTSSSSLSSLSPTKKLTSPAGTLTGTHPTPAAVLIPPPPVLESVRNGKHHLKPSLNNTTPTGMNHAATTTTKSPTQSRRPSHSSQSLSQAPPQRQRQSSSPSTPSKTSTNSRMTKPALTPQALPAKQIIPTTNNINGASTTTAVQVRQRLKQLEYDSNDPLAKKFYDIDDLKPLKLE